MTFLNTGTIAGLAAAGCILATGWAYAEGSDAAAMAPASVAERGLVIGSSLTYPPMYYLLEDGKTPTGMIIEISTAIAKRLGGELKVEQMNLSSQVAAIKSGKIDVIPWFTDTEERRKDYLTVDFMMNGTSFLILKGNPEGIASFSDFCGKAVGASRGTPQVTQTEEESKKCVAAGKGEITLNQYPDTLAGETALRTKKISAYLASPPGAAYAAQKVGDGTVFDAILDGGYGMPLGFGVIKSNEQLANALAAAFDAMLKDGSLEKIMAGYNLGSQILPAITINGEKR